MKLNGKDEKGGEDLGESDEEDDGEPDDLVYDDFFKRERRRHRIWIVMVRAWIQFAYLVINIKDVRLSVLDILPFIHPTSHCRR